jgi:hypothetical protein
MRRLSVRIYATKAIAKAKELYCSPTATHQAAYYAAKDGKSSKFVFSVSDDEIDERKAAIDADMIAIGAKGYQIALKNKSIGHLRLGMTVIVNPDGTHQPISHSKYVVVAYLQDNSKIILHSTDWDTRQNAIIINDIEYSLMRHKNDGAHTNGLLHTLYAAVYKQQGKCTGDMFKKILICERTGKVAFYDKGVKTPDGKIHQISPNQPAAPAAAELNGKVIEIGTLANKPIGYAELDANGNWTYQITHIADDTPPPEVPMVKYRWWYLSIAGTEDGKGISVNAARPKSLTLHEIAKAIVDNATKDRKAFEQALENKEKPKAFKIGKLYYDTYKRNGAYLIQVTWSLKNLRYEYIINPIVLGTLSPDIVGKEF